MFMKQYYKKSQRREEHPTRNKNKEGQIDWLHPA
jgi:hypothetical protein